MNINIILFAITLLLGYSLAVTDKNPQHCFDDLDKLNEKQIKEIYYMNVTGIAHNSLATDILNCFLRASHPGDVSLNKQYFDVFNKCEKYMENNSGSFGKLQIQELVALGLPRYLELDLLEKLKTGNKMDLQKAIHSVEDVMSNDIENSQEYKNYKKSIWGKIKV